VAGGDATPAGSTHAPRSRGGLLNQIGRLLPLPLPVPDWSKPIILVLLLLAVGLGIRAQVNARRARRLKRRQEQLTAAMDSMQAALVPAIPSRVGDLAVSAGYEPADGPGSGGDFYDAFALDDGRVGIILGDVSGHGRTALAHAVRMRYTLRAYVEAGLDPRSALKLAGSVFGAAEDDLFATVAIAIYDKHAASLTYATAGHPPPLMLHRSYEPVITCASPAVGWGVATGRRQTTIPFSKGRSACFFSDGLTEARTADGLLGRSRLSRIFVELGGSGAASDVLAKVRDGAHEIRDDMAACIITATTGEAIIDRSTEEFEVSPGQLTAGHGHRFLEDCGVEPDRIDQLIAQGTGIARGQGAALFRVTRDSRGITAAVSAPGVPVPAGSEDEWGAGPGHHPVHATPARPALPAAALTGSA
jgi:serine phosphatase RsbU (regulator of sigma subunit)